MFAQSANQANTFGLVAIYMANLYGKATAWKVNTLTSDFPFFCARGIMFAQSVKLQRSTIIWEL